jgi:hypothetical protein
MNFQQPFIHRLDREIFPGMSGKKFSRGSSELVDNPVHTLLAAGPMALSAGRFALPFAVASENCALNSTA